MLMLFDANVSVVSHLLFMYLDMDPFVYSLKTEMWFKAVCVVTDHEVLADKEARFR